MNLKDALGDRMKGYERRETDRAFLPFLPVYVRLDGRGFSRFTKGLERPFDAAFADVMTETTRLLVEKTHAKIGYTQSDEISLVYLTTDPKEELLFAGKAQKLCSVLAGLATAAFIRACLDPKAGPELNQRGHTLLPHFDCRAFQLPNLAEAANCFLWREKDAAKNAVSMAARAQYSHSTLQGKTGSEMQELLHAVGINFNNYPARFKRGVFVQHREVNEGPLSAQIIAKMPEHLRENALTANVTRRRVAVLEMPIFGRVANRVEVIFNGDKPILISEQDVSTVITEIRKNNS